MRTQRVQPKAGASSESLGGHDLKQLMDNGFAPRLRIPCEAGSRYQACSRFDRNGLHLEHLTHTVTKVEPGGEIREIIDVDGDGANIFSSPAAVAAGTGRRVFVIGGLDRGFKIQLSLEVPAVSVWGHAVIATLVLACAARAIPGMRRG